VNETVLLLKWFTCANTHRMWKSQVTQLWFYTLGLELSVH